MTAFYFNGSLFLPEALKFAKKLKKKLQKMILNILISVGLLKP
jgi:hypothetical protein